MNQHGGWSPYAGSGSIILAGILFIITGVLIFSAIRFHHPRGTKRPGTFLGISLVVIWLLSVMTFLVATGIYVLALYRQIGPFTGPADPITPVTMTAGVVTFLAIVLFLVRQNGFWVAFGSAIVGAIAAPMIFELPFDLIVMWRTHPPTPEVAFTLLFFLPLFLVEISSIAMLALSPVMKLSRYTLFSLAGMFLIFAIWALFGFAYPAAPLPITLNVISKLLAFATATSLFLTQKEAVSLPVDTPSNSSLQSVG